MKTDFPEGWRELDVTSFWRERIWPDDKGEYIFLGRVILERVAEGFGTDWSTEKSEDDWITAGELGRGDRAFAQARAHVAGELLKRLSAGLDRLFYFEGRTAKEIHSDNWGGITIAAPAFARCRANPLDLRGSVWTPGLRWSDRTNYDGPDHRHLFMRRPSQDVVARPRQRPDLPAAEVRKWLTRLKASRPSLPARKLAWKELCAEIAPNHRVTRDAFNEAWEQLISNLPPGPRSQNTGETPS